MSWRVVQWATGNIGTRALRAVIEPPGILATAELPPIVPAGPGTVSLTKET